MTQNTGRERVQVIVIGAGQAGLATGYHLSQAGHDFIILDAGRRIGHCWRERWDSLKLFTPAPYNNLPGMPFSPHPSPVPTKDEMAAYLKEYAQHFQLPVRLNCRVDNLRRDGREYVVTAGSQQFIAPHIVVATGAFQTPSVPSFAVALDPSIYQLHSSQYHNPDQLQPGNVLIVGVGQSGAEITRELARTRETWLAGEPQYELPLTVLGRHIFSWLWPILSRVQRDSRIGRLFAAQMAKAGDPVIGVSMDELEQAGVHRVPRINGVQDGKPLTANGQCLDVANVLWATDFRPDYRWISLPIFDKSGYPIHHRGVVQNQPGLYFVGLRFQHRPISHLVGGVGRDARYIVHTITERLWKIGD